MQDNVYGTDHIAFPFVGIVLNRDVNWDMCILRTYKCYDRGYGQPHRQNCQPAMPLHFLKQMALSAFGDSGGTGI